MSAAIQATTSQPFLEFMREQIFDPLGMRDTVPDPAPVEGGEDFPLVNLIREMTSGQESGYGLGWYVKTVTLADKPTRVTGLDGDALGGLVASLMTVPEHGIVVAVTSNISYVETSSIALTIAEPFTGHETRPRSRKPRVRENELRRELDAPGSDVSFGKPYGFELMPLTGPSPSGTVALVKYETTPCANRYRIPTSV